MEKTIFWYIGAVLPDVMALHYSRQEFPYLPQLTHQMPLCKSRPVWDTLCLSTVNWLCTD